MKVELVTSLQRQATGILADLRETKEAALITEHELPSAYLVDVDDYAFMQCSGQARRGIQSGRDSIFLKGESD